MCIRDSSNTRTHIVGSTETTDGYSMGENINPSTVGGNPYTDSDGFYACLLYTSPSPRDRLLSRMPSSA